jgi:hypothetical protein
MKGIESNQLSQKIVFAPNGMMAWAFYNSMSHRMAAIVPPSTRCLRESSFHQIAVWHRKRSLAMSVSSAKKEVCFLGASGPRTGRNVFLGEEVAQAVRQREGHPGR